MHTSTKSVGNVLKKESDIKKRHFAAIDMGSNSFQLQVMELNGTEASAAAVAKGCWELVHYQKVRVQLSAGLDSRNCLTEPAMQKALNVLIDFNRQLQEFEPITVRIVGTKALRQAVNSDDFVQRIFQAITRQVEIIDGVEEARLIYQGVANSGVTKKLQLVIDVGGGSTEFIVGEGLEAKTLDSTSLGCVTTQLKFFEDGVITTERFKLAETQASLKLLWLKNKLKAYQWQHVIGCSGVFEALYDVQQWIIKKDVEDGHKILTFSALEKIKHQLLKFDHSSSIDFACLEEDRKSILPSALAIVLAIFKTFNISQLELSDSALKDGVIFELYNEHEANKTRQKTLQSLIKQYQIDNWQSQRVLTSVTEIWSQLSSNWLLEKPRNLIVLNWAALLHEIGLSVSHHNHPAHGAYLIANTELGGFNKNQQQLLSVLIAGQSGEIPTEMLHNLSEENKSDSWRLLIILRLAKILRANRDQKSSTKFSIIASGNQLNISILGSDDADLELLWAALITERQYQKQVGFDIVLQENLKLD